MDRHLIRSAESLIWSSLCSSLYEAMQPHHPCTYPRVFPLNSSHLACQLSRIKSVFLSVSSHATTPSMYLSLGLPLAFFPSSLPFVTRFSRLFLLTSCPMNVYCLSQIFFLISSWFSSVSLKDCLVRFYVLLMHSPFASSTTITISFDVSHRVCLLSTFHMPRNHKLYRPIPNSTLFLPAIDIFLIDE